MEERRRAVEGHISLRIRKNEEDGWLLDGFQESFPNKEENT